MPDLRDQIRAYLDETSDPIGPDEVFDVPVGEGKVRPLSRLPVRSRISTGVLVAIAVAVVVVMVVGVPLFLGRTGGSDVADDAASTTTTATTTTTIVVESAPTTIQQVTVDVAMSIVPGLGTLTWERIDGDETTIPESITGYIDGEYVAHDRAGRWTSPDAVTWSLEEGGSAGEYEWFHERGDWAIGSTQNQGTLLRKSGDAWVAVDFPTAPLPDVGGVAWRQYPRIPSESDGVLVVSMTAWGEVAWGDVFGTFEVDCGQPEPCDMQPYGMWDGYSEVIRIENPHNGSVIALAEIVVNGDDVRLVDQKTGDELLTLSADPAYPVERILDALQRDGGGLTYPGGFVSTDGGESWVWADFPWRAYAEVTPIPDGGFAAYEFDYRWEENPMNPLVDSVVWTSDDGVTWIDRGDPGFSTESAEHVGVQASGDRLIATVITGYDDSTGMEEARTYVSTNGLDWELVDLGFPPWFEQQDTNFGMVISSMPQSRHQFWVSTDGGSVWHEVEGPPGSHEPSGPGGGYGGGGAVGDVIFVAFGSDTGSRTLWIGRFVP